MASEAPKLRKRKAVVYIVDESNSEDETKRDNNSYSDDEIKVSSRKKPKVAAKTSTAKSVKPKAAPKAKLVKSIPKANVVKSEPKNKAVEKVSNTKTIKGERAHKKLIPQSIVTDECDEVDGNAWTKATMVDDRTNVPNIWNEAEMLSQVERISLKVAENLITLLTEGCTLPFIARYRKTAVDNLMPDR